MVLLGSLTRILVKPWWIWECSSSWEHAQALGVIINTNRDCFQCSWLCCNLSKSNLLSTVGFLPSYQNHSQHLHFAPSLHRQCVNSPWDTILNHCCSGSSLNVDLPWVPFIPDDKQIIPCVVFSKIVHIIHSGRVCHSFGPRQTIDCVCLRLV